MIPNDFQAKSTVHYYFKLGLEKPRETEPSLLEQVLNNLVGEARISGSRSGNASFVIVDTQSVKNTDSAQHKGYDACMKVSGIKRYIAVYTQGLPHEVAVVTANVMDRKGPLEALVRGKAGLGQVQCVLADSAYTGIRSPKRCKRRWTLQRKFPNVVNYTRLQ